MDKQCKSCGLCTDNICKRRGSPYYTERSTPMLSYTSRKPDTEDDPIATKGSLMKAEARVTFKLDPSFKRPSVPLQISKDLVVGKPVEITESPMETL